MVERLTAAEAASQVVGLINSRPVSPWPHEIEAIIAHVGSTVPHIVPADFELVRLISAWRQQRDIILRGFNRKQKSGAGRQLRPARLRTGG